MHTQARLDGAEYFHRTNDDISFMSAGWITASVRALRRLEPPNIGVAGPKVCRHLPKSPTHPHTDFTNRLLLTHVLNTHLLIHTAYPRTYLLTYLPTYSHTCSVDPRSAATAAATRYTLLTS